MQAPDPSKPNGSKPAIAGDPEVKSPPIPVMLGAALGLLAIWSYWPTLSALAHRWSTDPQYSHGYLVPVFSCVCLWLRRSKIKDAVLRPSWWGVVLLIGAFALRAAGTYFF